MEFKIRPRENDCCESDFAKKFEAYNKFLIAHKDIIDDDLWEYFSTDFFHDAIIEEISYDINNKSLTWIVSCPNFVCSTDRQYFSVKFKVIFCFLHEFTVVIDEDEDVPMEFLSSEICTLVDFADEENHCESIIARTTHGTFKMIFSHVNVEPLEPLAYEMLLKSNTIKREIDPL